MPTPDRDVVFIDANVLAKSLTRSILPIASGQSGYRPVWSRYVEEEADRHLASRRHRTLSGLRRFGWEHGPSGTNPDDFETTDPKDRQVLADAVAAGAIYLITENVSDFGLSDLGDVSMSAVHYDLFMAERVTRGGYADALEVLAATRKLLPNTESEIHLAVAAAHPLLYAAHADLHPGHPHPAKHPPPATTFRGVRCVRCGTVVDEPTAIGHGLGPECR